MHKTNPASISSSHNYLHSSILLVKKIMAVSTSCKSAVCSFGPAQALQIANSLSIVTYGTNATSTAAPTSDDASSPSFADLNPAEPLPLIIRATNGKSKAKRGDKVKLSTVVPADGLEAFFTRYAEVCKGGMSGLKKRDRSKAKEKLKAKKKKLGAVAVEVKK